MDKINLIVAGSRNFNDKEFLFSEVEFFLKSLNYPKCEIISGCAEGADKLGELYAKERGYPIREFPALWDRLGKKAGVIRNTEMSLVATHLIAFWDNQSKGTLDIINKANKENLEHKVLNFRELNVSHIHWNQLLREYKLYRLSLNYSKEQFKQLMKLVIFTDFHTATDNELIHFLNYLRENVKVSNNKVSCNA